MVYMYFALMHSEISLFADLKHDYLYTNVKQIYRLNTWLNLYTLVSHWLEDTCLGKWNGTVKYLWISLLTGDLYCSGCNFRESTTEILNMLKSYLYMHAHMQKAAERLPTTNHTDTNSAGESTPSYSSSSSSSSGGNSTTSSEDSGDELGGSGAEEGPSATPPPEDAPPQFEPSNDKLEYTSGEWITLLAIC